jgi:hypothetical protein
MSEPIVYMDRSEVAVGRLQELEQRITELAELVERTEPRLLAYAVFFDAARRLMTVIHVHSDSASLTSHFEIAGPAFERFTGLVELKAIEVYGHPDDHVLERIRSKAALLGKGSVTVHDQHAGFLRAAELSA